MQICGQKRYFATNDFEAKSGVHDTMSYIA